ncbi:MULTISPECIES: DUF2630 family protein [Arthrobacter]|uniref:DUF2630 family protein n=1 Tax=Arthrobacter TaxID=1663 RepID=UPI0005BAA971|nr:MULTISPECIES: DUF2630 family protein [Arthrobacter]
MDDQDILSTIRSLVEEEHRLREHTAGSVRGHENEGRLRRIEESLDQCWDLLRQRRAKKEYGENPDAASVRPVSQVEGYWPRSRSRS